MERVPIPVAVALPARPDPRGGSNWLIDAERPERIGWSLGIWITIAFAVGAGFYMRRRHAKAA